mmetsp:Transcript_68858/g.212957  ORF Transcript_68858/g.212957 Transcript_68858/m.212957 type:complete len:243 (+) Transcript_68858:47-775(+)
MLNRHCQELSECTLVGQDRVTMVVFGGAFVREHGQGSGLMNLRQFWVGPFCTIDVMGLTLRYGSMSLRQTIVLCSLAEILQRGSVQHLVLGGLSLGSRSMSHLASLLAMMVGNVHCLFALDDRRRFPLPGRFARGAVLPCEQPSRMAGQSRSFALASKLTELFGLDEAGPRHRLHVELLGFTCRIAIEYVTQLGFEDDETLQQRGLLYVEEEQTQLLDDAHHVSLGADHAWDIIQHIRSCSV